MASSLPLPDEVRSLAGSAAVKTPCWTKFWTRSNSTRFQLTLRILRELPSKEVLRLRRLNRFFSKLCWDRSLWRLVSIGVGIEPHDDGDLFWTEDELLPSSLRGISALSLKSIVENTTAESTDIEGFSYVGITPGELARINSEKGEPWVIQSILQHHGGRILALAVMSEREDDGIDPAHLSNLFEPKELALPRLRALSLKMAALSRVQAKECADAVSSILSRAPSLFSFICVLDLQTMGDYSFSTAGPFLIPQGPPLEKVGIFDLVASVRDRREVRPTAVPCFRFINADAIGTRFPNLTSLKLGEPLDFVGYRDIAWSTHFASAASKLPNTLTSLDYWVPVPEEADSNLSSVPNCVAASRKIHVDHFSYVESGY